MTDLYVTKDDAWPDELRGVRKASPSEILSAALNLEGVEQLMEVTDKNAPVLSDGRYLPAGRYAIIPLPPEALREPVCPACDGEAVKADGRTDGNWTDGVCDWCGGSGVKQDESAVGELWTLKTRLWVMERVRRMDDALHRWDVPGRWWCDLADRVFWWAMVPELPRPKDLP